MNHEFHELHETNGWPLLYATVPLNHEFHETNGCPMLLIASHRVPCAVLLEEARSPLTYGIIGALLEVHSDLGPGYLEKSYQEAVEMALIDRGIPHEREAAIPIRFLGRTLKTIYRADFVCGGKVLVEPKAQTSVGAVEAAQVLHYLKGSRLPVALLANFGEPSLVLHRFVGESHDRDNPI